MNNIGNNASERKIVIVGATSGIGLAVAEKLVAAGAILGLAGRNLTAAEELAARYPGRVFLERIDVASADAPEHLSNLIGQLQGMDVYFHVAGVGYANPEFEAAPDAATVVATSLPSPLLPEPKASGRWRRIAHQKAISGYILRPWPS